jgi:fumarate reductase subunit D
LVFENTPLFFSSIVSAGLAFSIAYLMLGSFRVTQRDYLLGFPIGFSFLALSYLFLAMSAAFPSVSEVARWSDLFSTTYGFAFIAGTYFLRRRGAAGPFSRWLFSLAIVAVLVVILVEVVPPFGALPGYSAAAQAFLLVNLGLLGYIILSLNQALKRSPHEVNFLVQTGFILLAFGQYSVLVWTLDQGFWSYALANLFRLAGLVALLIEAATAVVGVNQR